MSTAFAATLKSAFSHLFPVCACGGTSRSSVRHIPLTVASLRVSLLLDWPMGWSARWPRGNTKPFIHKMVATFTHYWRHSSPLSRSQKGIPVSHTTSIMHNEQRTHRHSCLDFQDSAKRPEHLRQAPSLVYSERGRKPRLNPRFLNELLESRLFGQIHSQYPWNYCNESLCFQSQIYPKKQSTCDFTFFFSSILFLFLELCGGGRGRVVSCVQWGMAGLDLGLPMVTVRTAHTMFCVFWQHRTA